MSFADHALALWLKPLKAKNFLPNVYHREILKLNKYPKQKMTDKMADQITDSEQKRSSHAQCEENKECNDSFMSFLVYSFMKNMWRTVHFWDRPLLYFRTVHFHRWPSTYQSAYRHSDSKCPTLFPIFTEFTNQWPSLGPSGFGSWITVFYFLSVWIKCL